MAPRLNSRVLPRVIIDARMVSEVPHGIARYVTRLASGLRGITADLSWTPVFLVRADWPQPDFAGFEIIRTDVSFLSRQELWRLASVVREARASVYHSPSFSSLPVWSLSCLWVQTLHDLNHLHFGDWKQRAYYRWILKPFARRAATIATVSEFSRSEIASWLGVSPNLIEVVPNALEAELLEGPGGSGCNETSQVLDKHGLERGRYFFCLSNPKPHKNLELLIQAYAQFRKGQDAAFPLVLSISSPEGRSEGVQAIGELADLDARVLRANAAAIFFPSIYEGFGLPPVEAAIGGVPLAVSRIAAHAEGLVDLKPGEAVWVDPNDIDGWVRAFSSAQAGEIPRASLENRRRILDRFSERALAQHMDRIYARVLGSKT